MTADTGRFPLRAAILPLDYSPAQPSSTSSIDSVTRTEHSVLIQNGNWEDLHDFLTDPAKWLHGCACQFHHVPFHVRTPTNLVLQHAFSSASAVTSAQAYLHSTKPNLKYDNVPSFEGLPLPIIIDFPGLLEAINELLAFLLNGYFQVEFALGTDTLVVSYLQPKLTPACEFPCFEITKATVVTNDLPSDPQIPGQQYTPGRVHFDIGQNSSSVAATRATLIKQYVENKGTFCEKLSKMAQTGNVFAGTSCCVEQGTVLSVSPPLTPSQTPFKPAPTNSSEAPTTPPSNASGPTVLIQGTSSTSDCYICVDTAILSDGTTFYPTDAVYKFYCP